MVMVDVNNDRGLFQYIGQRIELRQEDLFDREKLYPSKVPPKCP